MAATIYVLWGNQYGWDCPTCCRRCTTTSLGDSPVEGRVVVGCTSCQKSTHLDRDNLTTHKIPAGFKVVG